MTILPYALGICLIAVTISMLLCLIRLIIGPSIVDQTLSTRYTLFKCNLPHYYFRHLLGQHFII